MLTTDPFRDNRCDRFKGAEGYQRQRQRERAVPHRSRLPYSSVSRQHQRARSTNPVESVKINKPLRLVSEALRCIASQEKYLGIIDRLWVTASGHRYTIIVPASWLRTDRISARAAEHAHRANGRRARTRTKANFGTAPDRVIPAYRAEWAASPLMVLPLRVKGSKLLPRYVTSFVLDSSPRAHKEKKRWSGRMGQRALPKSVWRSVTLTKC